MKTKKLAVLGMLAALSVLLVLLIHFPIFLPFLEYDPADVPILIAAFAFGPWEGVLVTAAVSVVQAMTVSSFSGWIGPIMHIVATGGFALIAGAYYRRHRTMKGAVISLVLGVSVQVVAMVGMNLLLTPLFMGGTVQDVWKLLLPAILPFNLLKAGGNAVITFLLYKSMHRLIQRWIGE